MIITRPLKVCVVFGTVLVLASVRIGVRTRTASGEHWDG